MKLRSFFSVAVAVLVLQLAIVAQNADAQIKQAKEMIEKQDYPAALIILNKLVAANPKNSEAYAQRARLNVRQNKYEPAFADAEKCLAIDPRNLDALNVRGVAYREWKKDGKSAIADFTSALAIDPKYYFAAYNRALTYGSLGRYSEAYADFATAIDIAPKNPSSYYSRGFYYQRQQKYSESIDDMSRAIMLDDKHADALGQRANAYFAQAKRMTDPQVALARSDAERAIALNPKQPYALLVRGMLRYNEKNYDGAYSDLVEAQASGLDTEAVGNAIKRVAQDSSTVRARVREMRLPDAKKRLEANVWDYQQYLQLSEVFDLADRFGDDKLARSYWESLVASNPNNICAIRMLGNYKGGQNWREMTNFLVDGLSRYDGKNGAECAAEIAFRIGREYSDRLQFDDANRFLNRAKEIYPKLRYVQQNIDANLAKQKEHTRESTALANGVKRSAELENRLDQYQAESKARREETADAARKIISHWENFNRLSKAFNESPTQTRAEATKVRAEVMAIKTLSDNMLAKYGSAMTAAQNQAFRDDKTRAEGHIGKIDAMLREMP